MTDVLPPLLADRAAYKARLEQILPLSVTGTTATANEAAAATAYAMVYCGAVAGDNPVRPSTIYWMGDPIAERTSDDERRAYYAAAMKSHRAVEKLCERWDINSQDRWYADTSREPIRDETLRGFIDNGAATTGSSVQTSSPSARYTLTKPFLALLSPTLDGDDLAAEIVKWQNNNLSPTGRARARYAQGQAQSEHGITVKMPGGSPRTLLPGASNRLVKAVVEQFADVALLKPSVVFVSQSGDPVNVVDDALLKQLGLSIDQQTLLPDVLIFDLDESRDELWLIEIVASDGPITEVRRQAMLTWAIDHGFGEEQCRFLTVFESRTASPFKRAVSVLARGSFAWFADEPDALLSWTDLTES